MGAYHRFPSPDVFIIADEVGIVKTFFKTFWKTFFNLERTLTSLRTWQGFVAGFTSPSLLLQYSTSASRLQAKFIRQIAQTFYFNTLLREIVHYWRTLYNVYNFGIERDPKFVQFADWQIAGEVV